MHPSTLHETLIRCAVQCREFAREHHSIADSTSESLVLSIDCAELCCQASVLHRSGSARSRTVAKQCIHTCESLLRQLAHCTETPSKRLIDSCQQARQCCQTIIEQVIGRDQAAQSLATTVCYGITLPTGVYAL